MNRQAVPNAISRRQLSDKSLVSDTAIQRAYADPKSVGEFTLIRLRQAAQQLGLPAPDERAAR